MLLFRPSLMGKVPGPSTGNRLRPRHKTGRILSSPMAGSVRSHTGTGARGNGIGKTTGLPSSGSLPTGRRFPRWM
jgi:hypothetical protein